MTTDTIAPPVLTIRHATHDDLDRLVDMGQHFREQTVYHERMGDDADHLRRLGTNLIDNGIFLVAEADGRLVGMWGGLVFHHHIANIRMASEVIWWVEPDARGMGAAKRLLSVAERMAREDGATRMQLGSWNERLDRFYQRLGYAPAERIFNKDL